MIFLEIEDIIINLNHIVSIQRHPQDSTKIKIEMLENCSYVFNVEYEKFKEYLNYVLQKNNTPLLKMK